MDYIDIVEVNNMEEPSVAVDSMPKTRDYQQEMLDASIKENIIIAQDTGSGKTLIAILRMRYEIERNSQKVSWFLAPTVALCEQQHGVIKGSMQVPVGLIHGALEPKQWTDSSLWKRVLENNRVIVSTPQVLLDALSHGYVHMGQDIGLLVFDEAHHADRNHPMSCIMRDFYFSLPPRTPATSGYGAPTRKERPMILGLTASPMFGGNATVAFRTLEANLDCVIRSPRASRDELIAHVHRPVFRYVRYDTPQYLDRDYTSKNLSAVEAVVATMNIEEDPYVIALRASLAKTPQGPERARLDQKLSKTIQGKKTYSHTGMKDLVNAAKAICYDLGPWAADWYVDGVVSLALGKQNPYDDFTGSLQPKEKTYLIKYLSQIKLTPVSFDLVDIEAGITDKVRVLLDTLEYEKEWSESSDEPYSGLIFVKRRDEVLALAEILNRHPRSSPHFRLGCLLGSSHSSYRNTFLDITRRLMKDQPQPETLDEFRSGDKNLIVATAVAEEGLDIQACGNVIRWDIPDNMASWAQSRGRARRKRSSFVLMFELAGVDDARVSEFERLERQMTALYQADRTKPQAPSEEEAFDEDELVFKVESTGAMLTPIQAVTHLNHFCAVLPNAGHTSHLPIYDIDPPDMPEGWHSLDHQQRVNSLPYPGPFGCTVTLPRLLPSELRVFTVDRKYPTKRSAYRHAAFKAYLTLYHTHLLNDHLLPLTSVVEPDLEEEVKNLLKDVEKRSGMASVTSQMNPWQSEETDMTWRATRIVIQGFAPVRMLTRVDLPSFSAGEAPVLYHPHKGRINVELQAQGVVNLTSSDLQVVRESTRRLFWCLYGVRMDWDRLDFAYLFEPAEKDRERSVWDARRRWVRDSQGEREDLLANAADFAEAFSYPGDISWVRDGYPYGKVYRFLGWKYPSEEELQDFLTRYSRVPETTKFLHSSRVVLLSRVQCDHAILMPSIIRHISIAATVVSLRETLFTGTPLYNIPFSLLITAVTAPVAQDHVNYQRLETLGDAVLKFVVSLYLLSTYPLWHEGYLTRRKDHAVSNSRLAKEAIRLCLYKWIVRDRFTPRKFVPQYLTQGDVDSDFAEDEFADGPDETREVDEDLSTKMLADVVEALIGAAYLHGGFNLGIECVRLFGLGIEPSGWQTLEVYVDKALSRVETPDTPLRITDVECMLGYTFSHKLLLVEAVTHASYQFELQTVSYERMEFLGDSVLDMIITHHLYHYPGKDFTPGQMHIRKSAVVNTHFLAFICFQCSLEKDASLPRPSHGHIVMDEETQRISLYQCLLHSSPVVFDQQRATLTRYRKVKDEIEEALHHGTTFPWAALTRLQAPKFFSDMIESLLGAVYLDSHGDLDAVRQVLRNLGIMQQLERILKDEVDVLHPITRLHIWAARAQKKVESEFKEEKAHVTCTITVEGREPVQATAEKRSRASREEARFAAAEKAIKLWDVKTTDGSS
ncbi:P-loop containing nucleoside triphosphate hydrolase protein [Rhizopogon vinicolor AM-OR11-026]|uniref:p-loop containing nucleoside triphosphate hydrolase protein n=1 Tax=Rhizopogon vinicolor AM-OR11-026 TaxID=1314800 RepID=A0A1B7N990_9AGAM|nr:P-loop containing nucleoside triphosphate hydrolase protein [Rhizopogon vinicolor AM-OR11-026]